MNGSLETSGMAGQQHQDAPYCVYSRTRKRCITFQSSFSAVFSGLSSFIYYPAIRPLAESLGTTVAAINLSISAYLIVAGIFPSIIGDIGDQTGRRPVSILAFTLYFSANVGLALQNSYPALLALRCIQSAGAAGTIAIAYGVIADITTPADRGSHVGLLLGFTNAAPCLGPVIGGIVAEKLSWRWIFWILAILSGSHLLGLVLFFPETSRKLVGNGSIPPPSWMSVCILDLFRSRKRTSNSTATLFNHIPNPLTCLSTLFQKGTFLIITVGSIQYTIYSVVGTSLATEMTRIYSLNYLTTGLVYLPAGVGGLIAALSVGRLADYDYRAVQRLIAHRTTSGSANELLEFPIEKDRLRSIFPFLAVASLSIAGYGWSIHKGVHIAVPLVLQFLSGGAQVAIFVLCGTLLTDFNHGQSATAQASYNLVRCAMAAGGVASLEPLIQAVGIGWACTIWAVVGIICVPLLIVLRVYGWKWRRQKAARSNHIIAPDDGAADA
ncbi:hypothetical protein AK830_g5441 [Neonectria ditissima]|uniref:Major facilitator superfamily (MFS) profile domain-containing protein n=1 Tax=Neonectria ditissima TaxID=78410 RepID=A0A0P7BLX0_9HYPO|nr:hypothetical protein AK830_g5441 [Neonectria ditissima]